MLKTEAKWPLTVYSVDTWTTIATGPCSVTQLIIANQNPNNAIGFSFKVGDCVISGIGNKVPAGKAIPANIKSIPLEAGETLQVRAETTDLHFFATGFQ
tara:strand:+ start:773 stop:1069 length:297 start_codon:yes stop_codon:yes gene_type:complete